MHHPREVNLRRFVSQAMLWLIVACMGSSPAVSSGKDTYQLIGTILREDGKPFRNVTPVVFLQGAITPFSVQTLAGRDGRFKIKNLQPGQYTLTVSVPLAGDVQRTVDISPSFADAKRRVSLTIKFDHSAKLDKDRVVSAAELSVPESARSEYRKAQEYLSRRDIKGAIECLTKATEIAPQFAAAWNNLGTIAYQTRRYGEAEHYFRTALERDPSSYSPLVNLGGALLSEDKFEESLPINQRAVKAMPGDALAHSQLGQSYFYLGSFEQAERQLKQAKALDPGHFSYPQLILVQIYLRTGRLKEAIGEMEEFLKLHPDSDLAPGMRKLLAAARQELK